MKKLIIALLFGTLALPSVAQLMTAQQENKDSTINVIAFFCKNDTLSYQFQDLKAKVMGNDTIVEHQMLSTFQLIVRDSTATSYEIECIPLETKVNFGKDTLMTNIMQSLMETMGDISTIITTDEYGRIEHIKNWKEIKDFSRKAIKSFCDSLYSNLPQLNEAIPRARFESQISLQFASEKAYIENSDDLQLLFSLHGNSFVIGKTENDDTNANGWPEHTSVVCGYGKSNEEYGFEDDYFISGRTVTTIPKDDVKEVIGNYINITLSDEYAGKVSDEIEKQEFDDAKVTNVEQYSYFYNGWPGEMEHLKQTEIMGTKILEYKSATWASRVWGTYGDQPETSPTDI